jgi:hypothetical protein
MALNVFKTLQQAGEHTHGNTHTLRCRKQSLPRLNDAPLELDPVLVFGLCQIEWRFRIETGDKKIEKFVDRSEGLERH